MAPFGYSKKEVIDMSWTMYCPKCGDELTEKEALNGTPTGGTFCNDCA